MTNALTTAMAPKTLAEAIEFARLLAKSGMVPEDDADNPGKILAKIQYGAEIGLPPMQAIQTLFVDRGNVGIEVTSLLAIVEASGLLENLERTWDEETQTATVTVQRKGRKPYTVKFGEVEALRAGLANNPKKDTHKKFPQRMRTWRALGYALNDEFADVCRGLRTREWIEDHAVASETNAEAQAVAELDLSRRLRAEFERLDIPQARRIVRMKQAGDNLAALLEELKATPTPEDSPKAKPKTLEAPPAAAAAPDCAGAMPEPPAAGIVDGPPVKVGGPFVPAIPDDVFATEG